MTRATPAARPNNLRALLIIGALVSLCVSDRVGPRLLPLPHASGDAAAAARQDAAAARDRAASRRPATADSVSPRVPMAQGQRRAEASQEPAPHTAQAAETKLPHNADALHLGLTPRAPLPPTRTHASRPPGRAPPETPVRS